MDVLREYYLIYGTYTCNRCKLIRWRTHTTTQCKVFSSNGIRPFPLSNKGVRPDYVLLLENKDIFLITGGKEDLSGNCRTLLRVSLSNFLIARSIVRGTKRRKSNSKSVLMTHSGPVGF